MQNRLRFLMGATAFLYFGPLMAGLGGFGWGTAFLFLAIFLLWLFILRPHLWPRSLRDWKHPEALTTLAAQAAVQALLVAILFGIGRGIGGVLGAVPHFPLLLPVAISFLAIPFSRLIWNPWAGSDTSRFLDESLREIHAMPEADAAHQTIAQSLIAPLADLPNDTNATEIERHLTAATAHADAASLHFALLDRARAGTANQPQLIALILQATDPALIAPIGGDTPNIVLAVLPKDPDLIALFATRLTLALNENPAIWPECPSADQLSDMIEIWTDTSADYPLRKLLDATNAAAPTDGLA